MSEGKKMVSVECPYCGQAKMVEASENPDKMQAAAEETRLAVEACFCEGAKKERRIKQRNEKKNKYLNERFKDHPARDFVSMCIETVDTWDTGVESVQFKMSDGYTHKIYLNKDNDLKIKATKKNEEEVTI